MNFDSLHPIADTDVEGFLRNEHENIISCAISEQKTATLRDFERSFEKAIQKDWDLAKRKIMEEMGLQTNSKDVSMDIQFGNFMLTQGNNNVGISIEKSEGIIATNQRVAAFSTVVKTINESRNISKPINVINLFLKASESQFTGVSGDAEQKNLHRCWNLLKYLLGYGEGKNLESLPRKFRSVELDSIESDNFDKEIVSGSRSWLEKEYEKYVNEMVRSYHAQLGGKCLLFISRHSYMPSGCQCAIKH
jgi:nuclear pore complex protein Nup93